jgi:DNA-binding MarR family transcriptional regulator
MRRLAVAKKNIPAIASEIDRDLRAVRLILRRPLEAEIARGGLTGPQQSAMSVVVASGGLSLKDLSRELGLAHSTVSGIVDRLEKRGMVERRPDPADRRITKIVAAVVVQEFVRETMPTLEMHPLAEALRAASPSERDKARRGVRILRELLERNNERPSRKQTGG